jgi:hypothetical protein
MAVALLVLLGSAASASAEGIPLSFESGTTVQGQPAGLAQVSSIDLVSGYGARQFRLVLRSVAEQQFSAFWVNQGRTFVVDVRNTYTPFRGTAVGEMQVTAVSAVRASQFLDAPIAIARVELDVVGSYGSSTRWVGGDLEITFYPGSPGISGTGTTPPRTTTTDIEPATPGTTGTPDTPPARVDPVTGDIVPPPVNTSPTGGRDNPFDPLLKPPVNVDMTDVQSRALPDVEALSLTGLVHRPDDPGESIALLRDVNGMTYRLKPGSRVKFGYVTQITETEVVCLLDRYGRRYEHKLSLPPDGQSEE